MDHSLLISMIEINVSMPDRLLKIESCQPVEEMYCQNDIPVGLLMKSRMDPFRKNVHVGTFCIFVKCSKENFAFSRQGNMFTGVCLSTGGGMAGSVRQGVRLVDWWGTWVQERWSLKQAVPIPLECILVT